MTNEILKETLLHYIELEYYANGVNKDIQELLEKLKANCSKVISSNKTVNTKAIYNLLIKAIKEEVEEFRLEFEERLVSEAEVIMDNELTFLDNTYNKRKSKIAKAAKDLYLTIGGVSLSKILFSTFDGRDTLKQFTERTAKNITQAYDTSLRSGYLFSQETKAIEEQVEKKIDTIEKGVESGVTTAIPSVAKTTDRLVFQANNLEVVWSATLDGRTCLTCASYSGLKFKSVAEAPSIPHTLCRCIVVPAVSLEGPVPEYKEFINSLSEEEQLSVLGKNRFEMYKNGVSLEKFINNGTIVKLKDLDLSE